MFKWTILTPLIYQVNELSYLGAYLVPRGPDRIIGMVPCDFV